MDTDIKRARNLDQGMMTMRQQVEFLLACVRKREMERNGKTNNSSEEFEQSQDSRTSDELSDKNSHCDGTTNECIEPAKGETIMGSGSYNTDPRLLDVIHEEPSKFDSVQDDDDKEESILPADDVTRSDNYDARRYEHSVDEEEEINSSECTSSCSCCQDATNYMSTSVSIVAEETIYSPQKKESSRTIRCAKIGQSSWGLNRADDSEEILQLQLQTRFQELEAEIEAFKTENSYVSKLRSDYEKEYNQFRKERVALLEKVKEEHLGSMKELESEKKKLQVEKRAFERHMREAKNRPNKEEKEEIRLLKEEVKLLKEEMNKKESRWAAAQARIRTEMKMLKDRNAALQEEMKELKKTPKKVTFAPMMKKSKSFSSINLRTKSNTSISTEENANKSLSSSRSILRDSTIEVPRTPESGIFTDTSHSSNDSCDGISEELRRSVCLSSYLNADAENDATSDDVSASELLSRETSEEDVTESIDSNGNREKVYADGRKEIWCPNGSVKKISSNGKTTKTIFYNGDVEEVSVEEDAVKYYHAASKTWHSKFKDELEIKEFSNGQVEKYFKDGSTEITSPDGTVFTSSSSGEKKWNLKDGTVITIDQKKQEKRIMFMNGQIEIHTPEYKRREYPDGTVKIVYNGSGMQETRYPNGRIRLKSQDGALISDTNIT